MRRNIALSGILSIAVAAFLLVRALSGGGTAHGTGGSMFGDGSDGPRTYASNTTDAPIDSPASGLFGTISLSATNALFAAGQKIMIHQTRGSTVATTQPNWELNEVSSYSPGTITTTTPLVHTYTTGGADAAQVLVLPQYTNVTVNPGVTLSGKAWNGATGGMLGFLANGTVTVSGTIDVSGRGYRGSIGTSNETNGQGWRGEGNTGANSLGSPVNANNGSGGGGGIERTDGAPGAGGGGNGTAGADGGTALDQPGGVGGNASGTSDLTTMTFGGGAGKGGRNGWPCGPPPNCSPGGDGGTGGGIVFVLANTFTSTGSISVNGGSGGAATYYAAGGGGGGAGGSVLIRGQMITLSSSVVTAIGGQGGTGFRDGGAGAVGRIRIEYCTSFSDGTDNPPASAQQIGCKPPPPPTDTPIPPTPTNTPCSAASQSDTDCDGVPDNYEQAHSCLNPALADGSLDPDGDALTNMAEYQLGTDPCNADTDRDGCRDGREVLDDPVVGGQRDPLNFWDYFDTPDVNNVRDHRIRVDDVTRVVNRYRANDANGTAAINRNSDPLAAPPAAPGYSPAFDRGASSGPHVWNLTAADGVINVFDVTAVVNQYRHDCA